MTTDENLQGDSNKQETQASTGSGVDELVQAKLDELPKTEVSAVAIARMAGLATSRELKVIEGKFDLMMGRIANLTIRMERVLTMLNNVPTGADMERLDVQISSLRSALSDSIPKKDAADDSGDTKAKMEAFMARHAGKDSAGGPEGEEK